LKTQEAIWRSALRGLAYSLGLGVGYFALGWLSLRLAVKPHNLTVLWLPNAFVLAVILHSDRQKWPTLLRAMMVSCILLDLHHGKSLANTLGYCIANTAEVIVAALALRRLCGPNMGLRKMREVVLLVLIAVGAACVLSSFIAALITIYAIPETSFATAWGTWYIGDAMGILVLTPFLLTWARGMRPRWQAFPAPRRLEALACFALLAAVSQYIFGRSGDGGHEQIPLMYLVFPVILWAAVRLGPPGATAASLVMAGFAVVNASLGHGPKFYGFDNVAGNVLWIQLYLLVVILSSLVLAAVWSERADTAKALEESEEQLARTEALALVMTTHIGLRGHWLKVPPTLCERLGYSEQALLSKTLKSVVRARDFGPLWERCQEVLRGTTKARAAEVRLVHQNGKTFWVEMSVSLVSDQQEKPLHFLAHIRDISERKRAELLLRKEKEYSAHIVSAAPAIICALDEKDTVLSINPAVTKTTCFTPEEIEGKSLWELLYPGELAAEAELARRTFEQNPEESCETVLRAKDGSERIVSWRAALKSDSKSLPTEMILIGNDVTARKRAEEQLRRTLDELESRVESRTAEFVEANRSLGVEIGERKRAEDALRRAADELEARVLARTQELLASNQMLAERSGELERSNATLALRSQELLASNQMLAERSGELERSNATLALRSQELERSNEALAFRSQELFLTNETLASEIEERARAQAIISRQAQEIFELSTPIVKLWRGMDLVPLIGTFESRRAQQLTTRVLERIAAEGSEVVLLDVTGVASIDNETAEHVYKTILGVRLLGARAVLTGVRASIARTLVELGIDLTGIEIHASLATALSHTLRKKTLAAASRRP